MDAVAVMASHANNSGVPALSPNKPDNRQITVFAPRDKWVSSVRPHFTDIENLVHHGYAQ